jgi:hypothetical protein
MTKKKSNFITCNWCPVKRRECIHYSYQRRAVCSHSTEWHLKYSAVLDWRLVENGFDKDIIPILKGLWKSGVQTVCSCAGHEGAWWEAYLTFKKHDGFIQYLNDNGQKVKALPDGDYGIYCWERRDVFETAPKEKETRIMRNDFIELVKAYA